MDEDSELLRRYAELGSEEAFGELVRRRMGLVYGSALRQLRDVHAAQEVAQAVFTDLARKAKALKGRAVLVSWLYTSTHYAVTNVARRERRRQVRDQEAYHMQDANADVSLDSQWERLRPVIDEALLGLDGRDREAVLLRFHEGRSFAEVGEALSLSEEAARKRVQRALERLRFRLSAKGITSSGSAVSALLAGKMSEAAPAGFADLVSKTALVQATGAGITAASLLTLFAAAKTGLGTAVLATLLAVGAAVYEVTRDNAASAALAASQAQYESALAAIKKLEGQVQGAEQVTAAKNRHAQAAAGNSSSQAKPSPADSTARGDAFMERHPDVRSALLDFVDAQNRTRFGPLYAQLGLAQNQIQQLEVLLRQGNAFGRDVQSGVVTLAASETAPNDAYQAQIHALLGNQGFSQFLAYSGTLGARDVVSNLAGLLTTTDSPLTVDQAQQVVTILGSETIREPPYGFNWSAAYTQAQGVLSAPQLDMLQTLGTHAIGWQQVQAIPALK